ncbi:hypothetical protein [Helicobacter sp. 23-1045]
MTNQILMTKIKEQITQAQCDKQKAQSKVDKINKELDSLKLEKREFFENIRDNLSMGNFWWNFYKDKNISVRIDYIGCIENTNDIKAILAKQEKTHDKYRKLYDSLNLIQYNLTLLDNNIAQDYAFDLANDEDFGIILALFKRYNKDSLNDEIFDKTYPIAKKRKVKITFTTRKCRGRLAHYRFNQNDIEIFTKKEFADSIYRLARTLLHELIHSISAGALQGNAKYLQLLTPKQTQLLKNIKSIYRQAYALAKKDELQGFGVLESLMEKYYEFLDEYSNTNDI